MVLSIFHITKIFYICIFLCSMIFINLILRSNYFLKFCIIFVEQISTDRIFLKSELLKCEMDIKLNTTSLFFSCTSLNEPDELRGSCFYL